VADLIRAARDLRSGARLRVPPLAYHAPAKEARAENGSRVGRHYLRFVVDDRPGIIAALSAILARHGINIDAVIQEPGCDKHNLPFVITLEAAKESCVQAAIADMQPLAFLREPPLDLMMEEIAAGAGRAVTAASAD
jgi:hypothetical protein